MVYTHGFGIPHMLAFSTGHWARNSFFKIPSVSCYSLFSSGASFTTGLEMKKNPSLLSSVMNIFDTVVVLELEYHLFPEP